MSEAPQLFVVRDNRIDWYPHKFQKQGLTSRARFPVMLKGWRGGFTSWSAKWLEQEMRRCGPGNLNKSYFAISPTHKVGEKGLIPAIQTVFCTYLKYATYNKNDHAFTITPDGERALWGHAQPEPTKIICCYAEDPDSFASATFIAGLADEVGQKKFKSESWATLRARLSTASGMKAPNNRVARMPQDMRMGRIFSGTTVYYLGWLEDEYNSYVSALKAAHEEYQKELETLRSEGAREELTKRYNLRHYYGEIAPSFHFIRFDSTLNPAFPQDEFEAMRKVLPEWLFDMRYRAIFRKPAGVIYESWDPKKFIIPRQKPKSNWVEDLAIDPGKANFYATHWYFDERADRHYLNRGYHRTDLSTDGHGAELVRLFPKIEFAVAGQESEKEYRDDLAIGGLATKAPRYKSLWQGINDFHAAIRLGKVFVFEDAFEGLDSSFTDQIKHYSRPIDDKGNPKMDEDPEDKEIYHWLDTARYRATWRFAGFSTTNARAAAKRAKHETTSEQNSARAKGAPSNMNSRSESTVYAGGGMRQQRLRERKYGDVYDPLA